MLTQLFFSGWDFPWLSEDCFLGGAIVKEIKTLLFCTANYFIVSLSKVAREDVWNLNPLNCLGLSNISETAVSTAK